MTSIGVQQLAKELEREDLKQERLSELGEKAKQYKEDDLIKIYVSLLRKALDNSFISVIL